MDPDANLREQMQLASSLLGDYEADDDRDMNQNDAARLAELVMALHGWIQGGGFLPQAWQR